MAAKWGTRGLIIHMDGIWEDVIFWFAHPYGLIDFYTKDAKYMYFIDEKLCVRDERKPIYSFETSYPDFEVDVDEIEFTIHDDLEVIEIARLDLWESEG